MIEIKNLNISFGCKTILNTEICIKRGFLTTIVGESGSGKSSLLDVLSLYKYEKQFEYILDDAELSVQSDNTLDYFKKQKISYLPQQPVFIDSLTCYENLLLECEISGSDQKENIDNILNKVGLFSKKDVLPKKLSGGEKQRLAIAIALIRNTDMILCDEITASLDSTNTKFILDILLQEAHEKNKYIIFATHQKMVIDNSDVVYCIEEEKLKLIKDSNGNMKKEYLSKPKKTKKHFLYRLAISRIKKRKSIFALMMLSVSLCIASLSYFSAWTTQKLDFQKSYLSNFVNNELFVQNNVDHNVVLYNSTIPPFDDKILTALQQNEDIESINPIYAFAIGINNGDSYEVIISIDGKEVNKSSLIFNDTVGLRESVFAYFDDDRLDAKASETTNYQNGIYINKHMAKVLGIETLANNMTLTFDLNIPVGMVEIPVITYYGGSGNEEVVISDSTPSLSWTGVSYVYQTRRVTLPVSGILPNSYSPLGIAASCLFMIPNNLINEYLEDCSNTYDFKDNELPLAPSNLKIIFKESANKEILINDINKLDENISILESFDSYEQVHHTIKEVKRDFVIAVLIVFFITMILLLAYSFQHRTDVNLEDYYLNLHGISKKEKNIITVIEIMIIGTLFTILSTIVLNVFLLYGLGSYKLMSVNGFEISYLKTFLMNMLASYGGAVVCDSTLLFERY